VAGPTVRGRGRPGVQPLARRVVACRQRDRGPAARRRVAVRLCRSGLRKERPMILLRLLKPLLAVALVAVLVTTGYFTSDYWLPLLQRAKSAVPDDSPSGGTEAATPTGKVLLSDQAIVNLGLRARAVQPGTYWKTIP